MANKRFIKLFIFLSLLSILILSQMAFLSYSKNPLAIKSQIRLEQVKKDNSQIVFVGDSSLEHGLDEKYFSTLLNNKFKVSNLALTADAHNLPATYNMIRHILTENKNVKYIVMMQNPSIWHTEFSQGGYCSTLGNLDNKLVKKEGLLESFGCFKYKYLNINAIRELKKQLERKNKKSTKTYKNGKLDIKEQLAKNKFYKFDKIANSKIKEINLIDKYLQDKNVKVYYVQGTLHYDVYKKYKDTISKQHAILKTLKNITFIEKFIYPENKKMGNSENHIAEEYKKEVTEFYFSILKKYL
ncbi:hypothetical protein [Halarcobacter anaerophilus]|uniref:SGNH/GDSL hydrolase family protein n=1 Tax=Halarcobacter anaerophilus TaxID=877500 RepID=A0A4Q0Y3N4_9BACT|nr:hypothetical protein [Halarcobacter anaerophilus]QDF29530.1 hypothetical protein AANAER_2061 [Halarcobacter anaerophilus]RXJ64767.1 hypothetical protein CRV06_02095 [Halarcobacter anaerophilus]